jgi:uncharacterized protein YjbI with pentapeptide repeats
MNSLFFDEQEFTGKDYTQNSLEKGVYENCMFINCKFSGSDLTDIEFEECEFENCDLSMVKLNNTSLKDTVLKNCKLMGLHFETCNQFLFSPGFIGCIMDHSGFYTVNLKNSTFKDCRLHHVDFTQAKASGIVFDNCDLKNAVFEETCLLKADLRTAKNIILDPDINYIKKAKFSVEAALGLLNKYDIQIS